MNDSLLLSFVRVGLNKKSRASSSTKPVYFNMPAEMESNTPLTASAVKEPEL